MPTSARGAVNGATCPDTTGAARPGGRALRGLSFGAISFPVPAGAHIGAPLREVRIVDSCRGGPCGRPQEDGRAGGVAPHETSFRRTVGATFVVARGRSFSNVQTGDVLPDRPRRLARMPDLPHGMFHPVGTPFPFHLSGQNEFARTSRFCLRQNAWTPQCGGALRAGRSGNFPQTCKLAMYCLAVRGVLPGCRISQRAAPARRAWRSISTPYRPAMRSTMSRNSA